MTKSKSNVKGIVLIVILIGLFLVSALPTKADEISVPTVSININQGDSAKASGGDSALLEMIFIITIVALAPSILIMMTSFLRIIISLHFLRSALGTQTMPPNQILIGISLFLTFFVMSPVFSNIKTNAIDPYENKQITREAAIEKGVEPLKEFMLKQTRDEDITLFMNLAGMEPLEDDSQILKEMPLHVLVPAFTISELRAGFLIGFLIYIPFIVIDMVVASTLMSMGMMMLPPATISLPFKILLFVLVDGWNLVIGQLIQSFN